MDLDNFEKNIGVKFNNRNLLVTAFTHTSYAYENNVESNEKLEFLGDAVLEFVVSRHLFEQYKELSEGEMTKVRAQVVCEESLYNFGIRNNFSDFLRLGRSELASNGNKRQAVIADSVEAVIAAIYLDKGVDVASGFILNNLKGSIEVASKNVGQKDYKTVLQEKLQENGDIEISYETVKEEGPDHNKTFTVELYVNKNKISSGIGKNKKEAEMEAARFALENIK